MIFDIRSKVKNESTPYSVDIIRSRLAEELAKSHAKVQVEENGDITWTASFIYFEFFNIMARELAGTEGRIKVTAKAERTVEIIFHIAMPLGEVSLILVSLTLLVWHFIGGLSAGPLLLLPIMWIAPFLYMQIFKKWWFKGFIRRQI